MRFKFHQWGFSAVLALSLLIGLTGCGGSPAPAQVTGVVTLDGAPVRGATVTFVPESGERSSEGMTNAAGEYMLRFTPAVDGAVVGEHRVEISRTEGESERETLPARYNSQTELRETLQRGRQVINFELTSQ